MSNDLRAFFYPSTLCVAGASTKEKSIGYEILKSIKDYGFKGKVLPVNPRAENVLGFKCYRSIDDISEQIDLAIIVVPKKFVEDTVDLLLSKGVKAIILVTAGFKETGGAGAEMEERIAWKIRQSSARMVGPNCMGVISALGDIRLNATFVAEKPGSGRSAFLSQSGALGAAVLNSLRETNIKFAHFISVGNKADVNENDLVEYWQNDENIQVIMMYLESFEDGESLIRSIVKGEIDKPMIILKAGRTSAGMKAAQSHTGALGSQDAVVEKILKQFGIIRAENLNEMFNTAKGFEHFNVPRGNNIGVITNAGGPAILAVDNLEREGLKLAQLSDETKDRLRTIVHPDGSVSNPVDLLPGATHEIYKQVNEILLSDKSVDAIVSIFVEPVMVEPFGVIEAVNSIKSDKPILQAAMPLPEFWSRYEKESKFKTPVFRNPEDPAKVIANLIFFDRSREKIDKFRKEYLSNYSPEGNPPLTDKHGFLTPDTIGEIAGRYKIPIIEEIFIEENEELSPDPFKYPVVIKGLNKGLIHKSDANAVRVNIRNERELFSAANEISEELKAIGFPVERYQIQPFINVKHELLVGGFRDPSFGPVIMFGSGGKYVEVQNDTAIRSAILCGADIEKMISETKIGQILKGVRGEKPVELSGIISIIRNCAQMMIENPGINEFDINPLVVDDKDNLKCVDIRIKLI